MNDGRTSGPGEPRIEILADGPAVSRTAATAIVERLAAAIDERGRAHWATTGGSSAVGLYEALARPPLRDALDWSRVHVWWGDDRYVPRDHPLSNLQPFDQILVRGAAFAGISGTGDEGGDVERGDMPGVWIPPDGIHPFPCTEAIATGRGQAWCAETYAGEVASSLPERDGWPAFDLVILGVGPDGHIMSVFPGSAALDSDAVALPIPAPTHVEPHVPRVTLNPHVLDAAAATFVMSAGAGKADILAEILRGDRDPHRLPAQLARRSSATWFLDAAAASRLDR